MALDTGWAKTEAMTNSVVSDRTEPSTPPRATAAHTALAALNMTIQVRRRSPRSTTGPQRKNQMAGA